MIGNDAFDIHATLVKLNQLLEEYLNNEEPHTVENDIIETIKSIIINEYVFMLSHQLGYDDIKPIAGEHLAELDAINSAKLKAVNNQEYEIASRARDHEKKIIEKILAAKFGNEHFKLIDEAQKKIIFRKSNKIIDSFLSGQKKIF